MTMVMGTAMATAMAIVMATGNSNGDSNINCAESEGRQPDLGKNILHIYWNFIFPPIIIAFAVGHAINKNLLQYIAIYCCFMLQP